ncbi:MAG: hypothetical protein WCK96_16810 [Methylococcales bacterium]
MRVSNHEQRLKKPAGRKVTAKELEKLAASIKEIDLFRTYFSALATLFLFGYFKVVSPV